MPAKIINTSRRNQVYSLMHQVLMAGYGFVLLFILVRILPQSEVGRWLLFVSLVSLIDMLFHGLLQTSVIKDMVSNRITSDETNRIQSTAFFISSAMFLLIVLTSALLHFASVSNGHQYQLLNDFNRWYTWLGIPMLIYNLSWWVNTGKGNFRVILYQRLIYVLVSTSILLVAYQLNHAITFEHIVMSQIFGYAFSSFFAFIVNRFKFSTHCFNRSLANKYFRYGKFNIGTMIGSSLLRNADTFMIAAFINPAAVAIYSLAQKIIEIFEVLLRSVASTTLPLLHHLHSDKEAFSQTFFSRILFLTALFIPASVLLFFYSDEVIHLMSGTGNYEMSALLLKIFLIYVLLLPADRLLGVALEACNRPQLNLLKTILLIAVNIGGNFIALYYFQSMMLVAAVSSIALITGIFSGLFFLHQKGNVVFSRRNLHKGLLKLKFQ